MHGDVSEFFELTSVSLADWNFNSEFEALAAEDTNGFEKKYQKNPWRIAAHTQIRKKLFMNQIPMIKVMTKLSMDQIEMVFIAH